MFFLTEKERNYLLQEIVEGFKKNQNATLIERLLKDKDVSLSEKERNYLLQEIAEDFKKNQDLTV